jgi:hypothetical protein
MSKTNQERRKELINNKFALHRIGHKRWDIISKNPGPDKELWTNLYEQGKNLSQRTQTKTFQYCGEELYLMIRPELVAKGFIINETANKIPEKTIGKETKAKSGPKTNNKKQTNKSEKIKMENTLKKIREELDIVLKLDQSKMIPLIQPSFNAKFMEFMLVKMMDHCKKLTTEYLNAKNAYQKTSGMKYIKESEINEKREAVNVHYNQIIEMIVGFNKIINDKKKDTSISETCLADLNKWIIHAKKTVEFNAKDVIIKRPELIFKTIYDSSLEKKQHGMYPSQQDIYQFVTTNESYLALVHTMLGSGKTSMVLPLCGWLTENIKSKLKILYCCPNEAVLLEVARMIYGLGGSFAIVVYDQEKKCLEYKWSSFANKNNPHETAIVYLADIFTTKILLEERTRAIQEKENYFKANSSDPINYPLTEKRIPVVPEYLLIGDELTKDADSQIGFETDNKFSITTETYIEIMKHAPPKIILMSATLPTKEQSPELYDAICKKNPGMIIKSFSSSEAKIGCSLVSQNKELYYPHLGSTSIAEIEHILSVIKTNPFIGRFYTFEVIIKMINTFTNAGLKVPDLTAMYENPSNANQKNIQEIAYQMLNTLIESKSDDLVKKVCQSESSDTHRGVDLSKILTSDISRFNQGCLVFSTDPVSTAYQVYQSNFDSFLDDKTDRNIFQQVRLDLILEKYNKEMEEYNKKLKRIEDKIDDGNGKVKKKKSKRDENEDDNNNDEEPISKSSTLQKNAQIIENKPIWTFPRELQICSPEHLQKVGSTTPTGLGGLIEPEDFPKDTNVSLDILTMLSSGIGIYSVNHPALDEAYLNAVLFLAKNGSLKILFTDNSIAYGTNLAVSDIIIVDEPTMALNSEKLISITSKHSIKTIFQMLGRAGRGGNLSYAARIYTTSQNNELINIIHLYIRGLLEEGTKDEVKNILNAWKILW